MSTDRYKSYLRDLVYRIREEGAKAANLSRTAETGREFQQGRAMAYVEILSMMQNQTEAFQIDRDGILLSGFDPFNDPLDPPPAS